jgi:hypothetical protein
MAVDPTLDPAAPPLTEAIVRLTLRDGRVLTQAAHGARGYPTRPATGADVAAKFLSCAARAIPDAAAAEALAMLRRIADLDDVRALTKRLGRT